MVKLVDYLPDYYDDVYEMQHLVMAEQVDFTNFDELIVRTLLNQFVSQADSQGLSLFEDQLGILVGADETLEDRRFTILTRVLPPSPITLNYFNKLLKTLGIPGHLVVDYIKSFAVARARAHDITRAQIKQLKYLLNVYLPANLVYDIILEVIQTSNLKMYFGVGTTVHVSAKVDPRLLTFAESKLDLCFGGVRPATAIKFTVPAQTKVKVAGTLKVGTTTPRAYAKALINFKEVTYIV